VVYKSREVDATGGMEDGGEGAVKYSYSPLAERVLERIQDEVFEACRDVETTRRYLDAMMDRIEARADYPRSGTPLYWFDRFTGYYYVACKAYIAFYYPTDGGIRIERILHGKSDYMRRLTPRATEGETEE